jgi:integrase
VDDDFIHDQTGYIMRRARGELARSEGAPIRYGNGPTARRELGVLIAALKHCATVKDPATGKKRLSLDEVPKIPRPRDGQERDRWLTYEEEQKLRAVAPACPAINSMGKPQRLSRIHRFITLALEDGARKEAIERLTWPQVDFENDRVVPPGVTKGTVDYRNPNEPESNKRRAKVRMTSTSRAMLERAFKERRSDIGFVLDEPGNIRGAFESAVRRSGLQDVSPHTLRHTWATRASQNGVSMEEIAVQLADSPQTVERTYLHHSPDHLKNAVNWRDREAAGKTQREAA